MFSISSTAYTQVFEPPWDNCYVDGYKKTILHANASWSGVAYSSQGWISSKVHAVRTSRGWANAWLIYKGSWVCPSNGTYNITFIYNFTANVKGNIGGLGIGAFEAKAEICFYINDTPLYTTRVINISRHTDKNDPLVDFSSSNNGIIEKNLILNCISGKTYNFSAECRIETSAVYLLLGDSFAQTTIKKGKLMEVEIYKDNSPPIANAGGPYHTHAKTLTLNASSSYDPDGYITGYRWDWNGDGEWDTTWLDSPHVMHTFPEGLYTVRLEIKDNEGLRGFDTTQVKISPRDLLERQIVKEELIYREGSVS